MTVAPGPSSPSRRRPLRLVDLMALVAAVALTLVAPTIMKGIIPAGSHHNWDRRQYVAHLTPLVLFFWTASLLGAVLGESRAGLRRTLRQPGHAALLAATTAVLLLGVQQVGTALVMRFVGWTPGILDYYWVFNILEHSANAAAASVAVVWLTLAVTRGGRRSEGWFDRLGCIVGLAWIAWGLAFPLVYLLPIRWLTTSGIETL